MDGGWMCGGVLLSFRERHALAKQKKPEGLVPDAVDMDMAAFNVRFRLVVVVRSIGRTGGVLSARTNHSLRRENSNRSGHLSLIHI
ncbi:hypothetical protein D3C72_2396620 [compost metagenome]